MRRAERVVGALRPPGEARQPAAGAQRADAVAPAGQDLVRIALVADVPDQLVLRRVEDGMDRHRQLDDPEPGAEVPAGHARPPRSSRRAARPRPGAARRSTGPSGRPADAIRSSSGVFGRGSVIAVSPGPSAARVRGRTAPPAAGSPPPSRRAPARRTPPPPSSRAFARAPVEPQQRHEGRLAALLVLAQPLARRLGVALDVEDVVADLEGEPERRGIAAQRLGVRPPEDRARLRRPDEERAGLQRLQVGDRVEVERRRRRSPPRCRAPGRRPSPTRPPPAPAAGSAAPAAAARCRSAAPRGPRRPAPAARRRPAPPSPRPTSRAPSAGRGAGRRRPCTAGRRAPGCRRGCTRPPPPCAAPAPAAPGTSPRSPAPGRPAAACRRPAPRGASPRRASCPPPAASPSSAASARVACWLRTAWNCRVSASMRQGISTGRARSAPSGPWAISATRASAAFSRSSQWARSSAPRA